MLYKKIKIITVALLRSRLHAKGPETLRQVWSWLHKWRFDIRGPCILFGKLGPHEGNAEEENNGYVVFKLNIHGSSGNMGGGEGGGLRRYSAHFHPSLLDRYLKTTWTVFPPPPIFAACWTFPFPSESNIIKQPGQYSVVYRSIMNYTLHTKFWT
jgi:hypothetical protein